MEIERYNNIAHFFERNKDFIEKNRMLTVFLIDKIIEVLKGQTTCFKCFSIVNEDSKTLVLLVTDFCLIYSNCNDDKLIPALSKELEFHRFNGYTFAGTKKTIEEILNYNNSEFSEQKHLIIYNCFELSPDFEISEGEMRLADINNLDTLIAMNISFKFEYNEKVVNYEDAKTFIQNGINDNNLFVWVNNNQLCAIAQLIYRKDTDYPEIGHVYTLAQKRNKGYAASLVYSLTYKLLKENNEKCMLYTDGKNIASNKAFTKIGYKNVGEYYRCYKEK